MEVELDTLRKEPFVNLSDVLEIPVVDNTLLYSNIFKNYILKNRPCKIESVGSLWNCSKYWVSNGKPDFEYLSSNYGSCKTAVYNCREKFFNSQSCENSLFSDYVKYWQDYIASNYNEQKPLLYLKDWHLKNQFPEDNFYEVPLYFASDWLNEYLCENGKDDYRFVYMGPKGTWTPFHSDVFTSFSWSVNICGTKKWIFTVPGEENQLKDKCGNLLYDIKDSLDSIKHFTMIQKAGEAIFVPSNWHHQVWNLEDTISVNHNWINGCNIETVWHSLEEHLRRVKTEINDCRDMPDFEEHCQLMLKASFGMDFEYFYEMIDYVAKKRIDLLKYDKDVILPEERKLGKKHAIFDLRCILKVACLLLHHEDVEQLNYFVNENNLEGLIHEIEEVQC